jgi:hypothetical protein
VAAAPNGGPEVPAAAPVESAPADSFEPAQPVESTAPAPAPTPDASAA